VTDPITLSVVRSGLEQICNEMDLHLIRSALSPIISETNDCAHGIYDGRTGETIAQGQLGLPVFLANMQFAVESVIAKAEREGGFREGDVWILNDTYLGGTHLNDVNLVVPVFVDGELFALLASTGHWMDIGGAGPGGWNPDAQEVHQEGLIIPPVRLFADGVLNEPLVETIMANVRLPREMRGDLTAMSSAVRMGEEVVP
jgi:N-methylhydantoinase B